MAFKKILFFVCTFFLFHVNADLLGAENDPMNTINLHKTIAKVNYSHREKGRRNKKSKVPTTPYWLPLNSIEKNKSVFFQPNVGLGLLYFHQVTGNLADHPNVLDGNREGMPSIPYKRGLSYNKTLLKEIVIGYRFFDWFKLGLSYQNQSGVFLYTEPLPYRAFNATLVAPNHLQLASYLSLNSIMAKVYFEAPYAIAYKSFTFAPFFGFGFGAGWQTWFPTRNRYNNSYENLSVSNQPQIIPNCVFLFDKGIRIQPTTKNPSFSGLIGFKFMFWGQARNLYKFEKQGSLKTGIFKPFRIKTIYSLAPYVGLQWNFPAAEKDYIPYKKFASEVDTFFIHSKYTVKPVNLITQFGVGPNFLYFSKIRGNLAITPLEPSRFFGRDIPYNKKFKYNRVPLYEYLIGYRYSQFFQFGLSLQTSSYQILQSPYVESFKSEIARDPKSQFKTYLNLYALMAKAYLYLPYGLRAGFVSFNFFTAFGFGPSWQSWYQIEVNSIGYPTPGLGAVEGQQNFLGHPKIVANPSLMIDMGFDIKNANPDAYFHLYTGIKYNLWGQVRNLGKASQQPYRNNGLWRPIRIKTLYSWTPYISVQWDFPIGESQYLAKRYTNTWAFYPVHFRECDLPRQTFFQANIGPNFLRFSGTQGNLGRKPAASASNNTGAPYQGRLSKNNPLLFEYLLGYRLNYWFKCALSLQSQTAIYICSKALQTQATTNDLWNHTAQFESQLQLYSLMLKPYVQTPVGIVFRNWIYNLYLGFGLGTSWQSWNQNTVYEYADEDNNVYPNNWVLRSKTSANVAFMIDLGLQTRHVSPFFNGSILVGVKYNQWGQARNIGKISQQWDNMRIGLVSPFRIKTVYSFAPYLGFQWNF